jgi:hypothetical protein
MALQIAYWGRDVANNTLSKICLVKSVITGSLETRWFILLGRTNGNKEFFFVHGSFSIRDGSEIRFWEDKWLGNASLREQYPALYAIVRHKSDTLAHVLGSNPPNVTFRRTLFGPRNVSWDALLLRLANIQLTTGKDIFRWNLHENKKFSVASLYNTLILSVSPVYDNKKIWKMKIPLKNKKNCMVFTLRGYSY